MHKLHFLCLWTACIQLASSSYLNQGSGKLAPQTKRKLVRREKQVKQEEKKEEVVVASSLLASGTLPTPTWTLTMENTPMTNYSHNVKWLGVADWPQDYCVDFDVKFPDSASFADGYAGAIALFGHLYITMTTGSKLVSGTGVGLMATIRGSDDHDASQIPMFGTAAIGGFSARHKASFCYKETSNEAEWRVDGGRAVDDYLENGNQPFPTDRNIHASVLTASHDDDTHAVTPVSGAELWSLEIRPWYKWPCFKFTEPSATSPELSLTTLNDASFPQNYCIKFNLELPSATNGNASGIEGSVALLGDIDIIVTHSTKLYVPSNDSSHTSSGASAGTATSGFGFLAKVDGVVNGTEYGTVSVANPGDRVTAEFCYHSTDLAASWSIDGSPVDAGYLHGTIDPYPTAHDVLVTLMAGSHTDDEIQALSGATLYSFEIEPWTLNTQAGGPAESGYTG